MKNNPSVELARLVGVVIGICGRKRALLRSPKPPRVLGCMVSSHRVSLPREGHTRVKMFAILMPGYLCALPLKRSASYKGQERQTVSTPAL